MGWLAKVKRYTPEGAAEATSVLTHCNERSEAQKVVDDWNDRYQTDAAYVEKWERSKMDWPDINDRKYVELIENLKNRKETND